MKVCLLSPPLLHPSCLQAVSLPTTDAFGEEAPVRRGPPVHHNTTTRLQQLLATTLACFDMDMFLSSDHVTFIGHPGVRQRKGSTHACCVLFGAPVGAAVVVAVGGVVVVLSLLLLPLLLLIGCCLCAASFFLACLTHVWCTGKCAGKGAGAPPHVLRHACTDCCCGALVPCGMCTMIVACVQIEGRRLGVAPEQLEEWPCR